MVFYFGNTNTKIRSMLHQECVNDFLVIEHNKKRLKLKYDTIFFVVKSDNVTLSLARVRTFLTECLDD
jgi:hypothetical protein